MQEEEQYEEGVYYKVLKADYSSQYGHGDYSTYLPKDGKPGKWMECKSKNPLELCVNGIHAYPSLRKALDARQSIAGDGFIYEMELEGEVKTDGTKVCARRGRLTKCLYDLEGMVVRMSDFVWQ